MLELFDESHFFICSGGMKPARFKRNQSIAKRDDGNYYLTVFSLRCKGIDFACRWAALAGAIIAAAMALLMASGVGVILLAAIAGAAMGARLGAMICGDMAAVLRTWVVIKTDAEIQGHFMVSNRPGIHLNCKIFGNQIAFAPNVKNEFTALCMFAANIGLTGLEGFMYVYAARGVGLLVKAPLKFVSNFATNYLASWAMKGVVMRGVFAGYSAANTYFTSSTEGGDKEQIANAALDGGFFIERAVGRLYQGVANEGYKDPETGETNWKAVLTDTSMVFSMGGIPSGASGKDATPKDVGNMARQVASEWKNPVETAKAEIGKVVDGAKQFREQIKKMVDGKGAHEKYDPKQDPRYRELSTERGEIKPKNQNEAEAALQAEFEGEIENPRRTDQSKGEPDLDFKIDGPHPYKYVDIKTPVDPKLRPLDKQSSDIGKNIRSQKAGSENVLHIVDLKNIPPENKPTFKQNAINSAGSSDGIIFINE